MNLISLLIPLGICAMFAYGEIKGFNVFSLFTEGVAEGIGVLRSVFPSMLLIFTAIAMFRASGALDIAVEVLTPMAVYTGFPAEVVPVAILKPFSGSGANAMLESVFETHGADSFIGKLSSVICGSTETTFYTFGVYLSGLNGRFGKVLFCSLAADIASFIAAYVVVSLFS